MSATRYLRHFRRDESGTVTVEMMLVLPLLIWCFIAMFVFFDAYRTQTINVKSAYTLGDQLSRETDYVTPEYMDALEELHTFLVQAPNGNAIRVTAYEYEEDDDTFRVIWSQGRGRTARLTNAPIEDIQNSLPEMADEEIAILTETWVNFQGNEWVGLDALTMYEPVVNRPRFASQLCWNSLNDGDLTTAVCQAGH